MDTRVVLSLYRFTLQPEDALSLPDYWGSTLRGGFGHLFRRIACPARRDEACPMPHQCPYHLIFETAPPPDAPALRNLDDIPRPFVLAPPSPNGQPGRTTAAQHLPDAELLFDLTLVGHAIDFLPYFVVAFRELGVEGLGRGRGHLRRGSIALPAVSPLRSMDPRRQRLHLRPWPIPDRARCRR